MSDDTTLIDALDDELSDDPEDEVARGLLAAMRGAVDPIRDTLAKLDEDIERREAKLRMLKQLRTNATRVVSSLSSPVAGDGAKKKNASEKRPWGSGTNGMADATLDEFRKWLSDNIGADEVFTSRDVVDRGFAYSYPTVSAGLKQLQADGVVRLDRLGPRNTRNYARIVK